MSSQSIVQVSAATDWKFIVSAVGAAISLGVLFFSIYQFLDTRKRELAWKKTEFIFNQASALDHDTLASRIVRIVDGHDDLTVNDIIDDKGALTDHTPDIVDGIHRLLNALDRISHAYYKNSFVSIDELEPFFWYFTSITRNTRLKKFCGENGYKPVLTVAKQIETHLKS